MTGNEDMSKILQFLTCQYHIFQLYNILETNLAFYMNIAVFSKGTAEISCLCVTDIVNLSVFSDLLHMIQYTVYILLYAIIIGTDCIGAMGSFHDQVFLL